MCLFGSHISHRKESFTNWNFNDRDYILQQATVYLDGSVCILSCYTFCVSCTLLDHDFLKKNFKVEEQEKKLI